jgi:hypothetical protein
MAETAFHPTISCGLCERIPDARISFDDGARWQSFQLNLPVVPITDIKVHNGDLVLSTQGRSFWILDDLTTLQQWKDPLSATRNVLFKPRDAYRVRTSAEEGEDIYVGGFNEVSNPRDIYGGARIDRRSLGEEPPNGATIGVYFDGTRSEDVTLEILDPSGVVVRKYSSAHGTHKTHDALEVQKGLNTFVWDMRYADFIGRRGPLVPPGIFRARVKDGSWSATLPFALKPDPRVTTSAADFKAQSDLLLQIRDRMITIDALVKRLRGADDLRLRQINIGLADADDDTRRGPMDAPPTLMAEFAHLFNYVAGADSQQTDGAAALFNDLDTTLKTQTTEAERLLSQPSKRR